MYIYMRAYVCARAFVRVCIRVVSDFTYNYFSLSMSECVNFFVYIYRYIYDHLDIYVFYKDVKKS